MPHFIIEGSSNLIAELEPSTCLDLVFKSAMDSRLFREKDIKLRIAMFDDYRVGLAGADFIHVEVQWLSGRSDSEKKALSTGILSDLSKIVPLEASVTVEVRDMSRDSYSKKAI